MPWTKQGGSQGVDYTNRPSSQPDATGGLGGQHLGILQLGTLQPGGFAKAAASQAVAYSAQAASRAVDYTAQTAAQAVAWTKQGASES